jgi:cysteine desulfurase
MNDSVFMCSMCSSLVGGGQENGRRGGTENVLLIAAIGVASRIVREELVQLLLHMLTLKLRLIRGLKEHLKPLGPDAMRFNGPVRGSDEKELATDISMLRMIFSATNSSSSSQDKELLVEQLPNTVSVSFKGINAMDLIAELSENVACSTGSACHHGSLSEVLKAVKADLNYAFGTLRLSMGRHSTVDEMDRAAKHIAEAVIKLTSAPKK